LGRSALLLVLLPYPTPGEQQFTRRRVALRGAVVDEGRFSTDACRKKHAGVLRKALVERMFGV
jgi:hypothetical protein